MFTLFVCVFVCLHAGKTSCGPVTTADQDDLIVIEEGAKRNHCQPDGDSKLLENISETPPTQYRTTEDGGYEVDPDAVSTSPIRGFCAIRELQAEEGREIDFHNQFPSRGSLAGRSASNRGRQHMQPNSSSCSSMSDYCNTARPCSLGAKCDIWTCILHLVHSLTNL